MPSDDAISRELATMNEKLENIQKDMTTAIDAKSVSLQNGVKIDNLANILTKIIYAQIGLIAAIIGVKFIPQSPIDWYGATTYGSRLLLIMATIFVILRSWQLRKQNHGTGWLRLGLISFMCVYILSIVVDTFSIINFEQNPPIFFTFLVLRGAASIFFIVYAWKADGVSEK